MPDDTKSVKDFFLMRPMKKDNSKKSVKDYLLVKPMKKDDSKESIKDYFLMWPRKRQDVNLKESDEDHFNLRMKREDMNSETQGRFIRLLSVIQFVTIPNRML